MTRQPDELAPESEPDRQDAVRHAAVALRSIGQPNSVADEFNFWDDRYEGRRLFSELLGTFFLVLVAVGGGMVSARFGGNAVPYGAKVVAPALMVGVPGRPGKGRRHRGGHRVCAARPWRRRSEVAAAQGAMGGGLAARLPAAIVRPGVRCSPVRLRNVAGVRHWPCSRPGG
jgi:hypothetical protein